MQREAFEQRWQEILDQRGSPEDDAQLQDLDEQQREIVAAGRLLLDGLTASEIPPLSDDFAHRVVADLRVDRSPKPERKASGDKRIVLLLVVAACAALVLVAAVPLWNWLKPGSNSIAEGDPVPPINVVEDEDTVPDGPATQEVTPPTELAIDDGSDDVNDKQVDPPEGGVDPDRVAKRYQEMYALILELQKKLPANQSTDHNMLAAWDDVTDGLRPVATSVGGALNALRRNIPPSEKNEPADKPQARRPSGRSSSLA